MQNNRKESSDLNYRSEAKVTVTEYESKNLRFVRRRLFSRLSALRTSSRNAARSLSAAILASASWSLRWYSSCAAASLTLAASSISAAHFAARRCRFAAVLSALLALAPVLALVPLSFAASALASRVRRSWV